MSKTGKKEYHYCMVVGDDSVRVVSRDEAMMLQESGKIGDATILPIQETPKYVKGLNKTIRDQQKEIESLQKMVDAEMEVGTLRRLVNSFSIYLSNRLVDKAREGKSGWEDPEGCSDTAFLYEIKDRVSVVSGLLALGDVRGIKKELLDIAAFAMFIWSRY